MRFQDAARDARAVVYAGIQADPQVARTAALLADATPGQRVLARAVMNGQTTDPDDLAGDVSDAVRSGGPARRDRARPVRGDPGSIARGRRPRRAGPQPGPRRARRGADRAAPRPTGRGRSRPSRTPRPVRWRARRDPPVRRHRRARRRGRGVRLQVGRARDQRRRPPPARRRAVARRDEDERSRSRSSSSTPGGRARSASPGRPRPTRGPRLVTIETLNSLAGRRRRRTDRS